MFVSFEETRCPVCGTFGQQWEKEEGSDHHKHGYTCPSCSTTFSNFGILNMLKNTDEHEWN